MIFVILYTFDTNLNCFTQNLRMIQCVRNRVTRKFTQYTEDNCPETKLCWIPQMDAILPSSIQADIKQCTSWQSYHCMLQGIKEGKDESFKCPFNCEIPSLSMKLKDVYLPPFYRVITKQGIILIYLWPLYVLIM